MNTRPVWRAILTAASILSTAGLSTIASAAGPYTFSYGGRLADANDVATAGPVDIELKFYRTASGGTPLGVSPVTFSAVALTDGVFQVDVANLSQQEMHLVFAQGQQTWVEVIAQGTTYPRQMVIAVPYAMKVPTDNTLSWNSLGELSVGPSAAPTSNQFLTKDANGARVWGSPAITSAELGASSVGGSQLQSNSVGSSNIVDGTITSADLGASSVGSSQLQASSVGSSNIVDGTITSADLGASSVGSSQLQASSVGSSNIIDGTIASVDLGGGIDAAKISGGTISNAEFDNLNNVNAAVLDADGNAGPLSIGTSDNTLLSLISNGSALVQVDGSVAGVGIGTSAQAGFRLNVNGVMKVNSPIWVAGGSAGSPAYTFDGNQNTGMFKPIANTLAFSAGGTEAARIDSTGLAIGTSGTPMKKVHNGIYTCTNASTGTVSFPSTFGATPRIVLTVQSTTLTSVVLTAVSTASFSWKTYSGATATNCPGTDKIHYVAME